MSVVIPEQRGRVGRIVRWLHREAPHVVAIPPRKEDAPCCERRRLTDGRPVLGCCSPECIRRQANWQLILDGKPIPRGGALEWRSL